MKAERVPIDSVKLDPANVRRHGEKNLSAIKSSLSRFGQQKPIVVDADGIVRAGNGTWTAAKALGWKEITVVRTDLKGSEATAYAIADNRTGELAEWDEDALAQTLAALQIEDEELALDTGFDAKEIDALLAPDEVTEDEFPEPPADPITKPGDLWTLGDHRLLCGDSTKAEDVERLMAGAKAESVMTDPPYGMSYKGKVFGKGGLENDGEDEFEKVLTDAVSNLPVSDAAVAICFSPSRLDGYFRATAPLNFHRLLTIYKPNRMGYPWRGWILTSEVVGIFSMGSPSWGDGKACHDVYVFKYEDRPDRSIDHPTVKPLKIIADVLEKLGGGSVYDPFLGSGTTLIAAEQLGRKCYGMEISPAYCDVIVKRWETLTGKKAKRAAR